MKPGDGFALSFDAAAKKIFSIAVKSNLDNPNDDIVTLNTSFTLLSEGLNYLSESLLNAAAREVEIRITNSAYRRIF